VKLITKSFCPYAWNAIAVKPDGTCGPCCRFEGQSFSLEMRNSGDWQSLRMKMLKGEAIEGCKKCYSEEKSSLVSMRQVAIKEYGADYTDINTHDDELRYLEVSLGRTCNLKCMMCSPLYSSAWDNEYKKLGWSLDLDINNEFDIKNTFTRYSKLNKLKLLGGEPLLCSPKEIEDSITNIEDIHLTLNTNGTCLPSDEWLSFFEKCRKTTIYISIDGVGSVNDFIRYPSKWDTVVKTVHCFLSLSLKYKTEVKVHSTVSIYNIFDLANIYEWWRQTLTSYPGLTAIAEGVHRNIKFVPLSHPSFLSISYLDPQLKEQIADKLMNYKWGEKLLNLISTQECSRLPTDFTTYTKRVVEARSLKIEDCLDRRILKELWATVDEL
jgi:sulfatase maturation enzyme AslB (radical SAM superfamily)